ncbi:FAD-dependent monooxygenase [Chelativorans sp. EGI FJ00035]|uniref:FAD-dependent monooxygenase n=1 Tax=Chelativorans salis TaxID=2978478 RepID=A0ABT2LPN3_9HYPH|nr:FAD-dependent monooxygenase [Chelativorans sp. EGI FJ00035]
MPDAYRVTRLLRTDTLHIPIRQAPTYQKDGVFLGGDAAHVHSPVGARGMNLGIEDAAAFASRYGEGGLDGYTQERRPVGKRWIELSERLLSVAQTSAPGKAALRDLAFRTLGAMPFLQRPALERMAGLKE